LLEGGVLGALPDQAKEMIAIARQNSDRLIRLINEILDLDKIEAGKMELKLERVEVTDLAQQALEGIRGFASSSSIELHARIGDNLTVNADRDRLVQVLTNLLSNAIKFSPASGAVELRAEVQGASVRFAVQDSGPGIPEHNRQLLFRKFQQLDSTDSRRKGGTGLGLAITKAIVEQHRGRIWVESEVGKGATFLFELPRLAATPTPFAGLPAMMGRRKILLVEDDPDLAGILARTLAAEGLQPLPATSLAAARSLLLEGRPDAVLLDLGLPDGDGLELLEELRRDARTSDVPVLVMSAIARDEHKKLAEPVVVDWLHKPFEQMALRAALQRALKGGRGKVLLVAPDVPARAELVDALGAAGLQMELAQTTREAVPLLVALAPDLVLYEPQPGDDEVLYDLVQKQQLVGRPTPLVLYAGANRAPDERRRLAASLRALLPRGEATQESFVRAVREVVDRFAPRRAP
jgi:DNA-binding response OmpR family regulator/two-component sensor histidine kinase